MNNQEITTVLFSVHTILFGVKIWALSLAFSLVMFARSNNKKVMIVFQLSTIALLAFSLLMVGMELWFLYCFFMEIDLYYYEYASVIDQIVFTLISMAYLIKEEKYGKR